MAINPIEYARQMERDIRGADFAGVSRVPEVCAAMASLVYLRDKADKAGGVDKAAVAFRTQSMQAAAPSTIETYNDGGVQAMLLSFAAFAVLAIRGSDDLEDWQNNLGLDWRECAHIGGMVHEGFYGASGGVGQWAADTVDSLRGQRGGGIPVYLTGHSYGGALAALVAAQWLSAGRPFHWCHTFGAPRVGNLEWVSTFKVLAEGRFLRWVNNNDLVPRLPPRAMGYRDLGLPIYIRSDGSVASDPSAWLLAIDRPYGTVKAVFEGKGVDWLDDHHMLRYWEGARQA